MGRLGPTGAVLVMAFGCSAEPHSLQWEVQFTSSTLQTRAAHTEVAIYRGGCASSVTEARFALGESQAPRLEPGVYGFAARASDSACVWYAEGCTELQVPSERQTVRVVLSQAAEEPACAVQQCVSGRCVLSDGGVDATGCNDRYASAVFCDGFEVDGLPAWDREKSVPEGTITRTSFSFRGDAALHVASGSVGSAARVETPTAWTYSSGRLYMRAYVYLPSTSVFENVSVMEYNTMDHSERIGFHVRPDRRVFLRTDESMRLNPDRTLPADQWHCVEFFAEFGTSGQAAFWIDGELWAEEQGLDITPVGGVREARAGMTWVSSIQPPAELMVDEVVVDTARIGCD